MPANLYQPRCYILLFLLLGFSWQPATAQVGAKAPRSALMPGSIELLTSDSVKLFVKVAGQGEPCVVVHGGPGAGCYGLEHLGLQPLESRLQLIYLDQRGSGRSAASPRHNYALARQVQDLEELRIRLGLKQWTLLAHSFGGVMATAYAQRYPERVRALVLVNAVLDPTASLAAMVHYGDSLLPAAARPVLPASAPLLQRLGLVMQALGQRGLAYQLQYATDTAAARASGVMRQQPGNQDFARHVFDFPDYGHDYAPATATLTMPVLVLAGHDDYTAGPASYRAWRFPQQRVVVLPGRHSLLQEQPTKTQQAIRTFVAALPVRR